MSGDGVLDLAALRRLLDVIGGDPDDLEELKEEFYESAPEIVADLRAAAANGDIDGLRVGSHSLKGNARDFGATHLAELCAALEAKTKADAPFDATADVAEIAAAEEAARAALADLQADALA